MLAGREDVRCWRNVSFPDFGAPRRRRRSAEGGASGVGSGSAVGLVFDAVGFEVGIPAPAPAEK